MSNLINEFQSKFDNKTIAIDKETLNLLLEEQKKLTYSATLKIIEVIISNQTDINWRQGLLKSLEDITLKEN